MTSEKIRTGTCVTIAEYKGVVPEGKVFLAWNTREDGTGVAYKPGKTITMVESLHLWPMFVDAEESA